MRTPRRTGGPLMSVMSEALKLTVVTGEASTAKIVRKRVLSVLAHVALIGASILDALSAAVDASASFRPENEIFSSTLLPSSWSIDSYFRGWDGLRVSFGTFFWNSLVISVTCVVGNLIACSMAAFAFARLRVQGAEPLVRADADDADAARPGDADPAICAVPRARLGRHHPAAGGAQVPRGGRVLRLPDGAVLPRHSARARRGRA